MNIKENNKLIAEFMGWGRNYNYTDEVYSNKNKNRKVPYWSEYNSEIYLKEMKYQQSWDWLMPVVDKIHSTEKYFTYVAKTSGQFKNEVSINPKFIEETYKDVVQFIKWYNTKTRKEKTWQDKFSLV